MERWLQCVYTQKEKKPEDLSSKAAKHDKQQGLKCEDNFKGAIRAHLNWESNKLLVENTEEMVGSAVLSLWKSKLDAICISGKEVNQI